MIQQSTMNALHNARNPYQGKAKRVLTVCSAGLLRSPTLASVLHEKFGYNVRCCGHADYALVPLSTALLRWADEIVCVDPLSHSALPETVSGTAIMLNIPDQYEYNDPELRRICLDQYEMAITNPALD